MKTNEEKEKQNKQTKKKTPDGARRGVPVETYKAPPPPSKGSIIGIDCHPDSFTAAVFRGSTPHDARHLCTRGDMDLDGLLAWAREEFGGRDLFLMEAGSNSFEICRRLGELGLRCVVLESGHVGYHAKKYADNDKIAAARIAKVYLAGDAPCVWVPDEVTRVRRELLHAYQRAVASHTETTNSLKGYLNQMTIRPGRRNLSAAKTREWIASQRGWDALQQAILDDHYKQIDLAAERRKTLGRHIAREVASEPRMLGLMGLLGIGLINAFALVAIIGDAGRFDTPRRLVSYLGLNPGRRQSGNGKLIKVGVGGRGRKDLRSLLVQGAQAVMNKGRGGELRKWGLRLMARKGNRNVAVAAVARKLATQVWHLLKGNRPEWLEASKSRETKLKRLTVTLGKKLRGEIGLPATVKLCVEYFNKVISENKNLLLTKETT